MGPKTASLVYDFALARYNEDVSLDVEYGTVYNFAVAAYLK